MSNFWSPPTRNKRQRETAFANTVYYAHEGFCGCGDFAFHLLSIVYSFARGDTERLLRQVLASSNPPLCLTTGEDPYSTYLRRRWRRKPRYRWPRRRRARQTFYRRRRSNRRKPRKRARRVRRKFKKKTIFNTKAVATRQYKKMYY